MPSSIDDAPRSPLGMALAVDLALLIVFAFQHSVMARPAFKRWWTRIVPEPAERSTYVLFSSLALVARHPVRTYGLAFVFGVLFVGAAAGYLLAVARLGSHSNPRRDEPDSDRSRRWHGIRIP